MFHRGIVTKSVVSQVNCLYFIILCLYNYNDITQKPHDRLFQKSGQRGFDGFGNMKSLKSQKVTFHRGK